MRNQDKRELMRLVQHIATASAQSVALEAETLRLYEEGKTDEAEKRAELSSNARSRATAKYLEFQAYLDKL